GPVDEAAHGGLLDARRRDDLEEGLARRDAVGERGRERPVERDDAAERAARVALEREIEGALGVGGDRDAARIRVLDDPGAGALELPREPPRRVGVEVVVEGQLLAAAEEGARERALRRARVDVERGRLVRVLAVAQRRRAPRRAERERERL